MKITRSERPVFRVERMFSRALLARSGDGLSKDANIACMGYMPAII
ncbi:hypothetical protein SAMN05216417_11223 [Nitrosospira multiformis]|uniref:Uncharacterized protein n=1 Tax=Nitrosospira multiformis TaxID=1231 RepID=A0A1I7HW35_9PROT|nr:hypothetical protein SAMN05216417_11223 [Nitrosospira multiformis]